MSDDKTAAIHIGHMQPHPILRESEISREGLKVGQLWDGLDEIGKAIILGQIYQRAEGVVNGEIEAHWKAVARDNIAYLVPFPRVH